VTVWLLAAAIVVVAAAIQAVTGFGFSLTALPVLTLLYGTRDGIVLNLLLSAGTNLWVSWRNRADAVPSLVRPLTVGGVLGVVPGVLVFHLVSSRALRLGIGAMLVVAALLRLSGARWSIRPSAGASRSVGAVSGFLQGSIGLGGPPVSLYLSGTGLDKVAYRSTIATFFVLPNAVNLPAHLIGLSASSWHEIGIACTTAVCIPLGAMVGQAAFTRMHQVAFERVVFAVIACAAATAVYQGISGDAGHAHASMSTTVSQAAP
jgi:uncharacterized membrane protein YfcA